jgi:hypothetical protein
MVVRPACVHPGAVLFAAAESGEGDAQEQEAAPEPSPSQEEPQDPAAAESLERMEAAQEDAGVGDLDVTRDTATAAALVWEETGAATERQSSKVEVVAAQRGIDGEPSPLLEQQPPEATPEPGGEQPTTADAIRLTVTVNGKPLDVTEDLNSGTVTLDPHGASLTYQDVAALEGAAGAVEARLASTVTEAEAQEDAQIDAGDAPHPRLAPQNPLDPQDDLLLRTLTLLSMAPVGGTLEPLRTEKPDPGEVTVERPGQEGEPPPATAPENGPETASVGEMILLSDFSDEEGKDPKECERAKRTLDFKLAASACSWYDNEFYIHTCATTMRWNQHDHYYHCMQTDDDYSGPYSTGCNGRCGAWGSGYGLYTLDCLDHDEAVEAHGYFDRYVQDEFEWTFDDAYWADYYWYRKCSR